MPPTPFEVLEIRIVEVQEQLETLIELIKASMSFQLSLVRHHAAHGHFHEIDIPDDPV